MKTFALSILVFFSFSQGYSQSSETYQLKLNSLNDALSNLIHDNEPGASISITHKNKLIFEAYYGAANIEHNEKLQADNVLGIASMSKQFTGMAILFLADEGKLNLDDDIRKYFPELPIENRHISIKQLLSHTSGLPELTQNDNFMNTINQAHHVQDIIETAFTGEFRSETGEKFIYNNTGYTIMVALIEKLSGMSFADYLNEKIFKPLHMNSTYTCDYDTDADNAVQRYEADSLGFHKAGDIHFSNLIGGGGMISNVRDMAKWNQTLVSGNYLPKNYKKIWESNILNSGDSTGYGLGMGNNEYEGIPFYYHPGMGSGMNSINLIFPDSEISISVIRNMSKPELTSLEISLMAAELLFSEKKS